jgi:hypothetical protein
MRRTLLTAFLIAACLPAGAAPALELQEFSWPKDDIFCSLSRAEAAPAKDKASRYVFVTALLDDPQVAIERGYAQLGSAPEQLDFVDRKAKGNEEIRRYRRHGDAATEITVDVTAKKEGKQTRFIGTVVASRQGQEVFSVAVEGNCR